MRPLSWDQQPATKLDLYAAVDAMAALRGGQMRGLPRGVGLGQPADHGAAHLNKGVGQVVDAGGGGHRLRQRGHPHRRAGTDGLKFTAEHKTAGIAQLREAAAR